MNEVSFADDLKAQSEAVLPHEDVEVLLNGNVHVFRFRQIDGVEWTAETDKYPARPGVLIDARYGYNLRALVKGIAPKCGVRLDGDTEILMRVEKASEGPAVDEWGDLWKAIDGPTFARITDAIWGLNEYRPGLAVEAAKKALSASESTSI